MIFAKPYTSISGYLLRWTLFKLGRLHVRFHQICDIDRTPFYHTHPFNYVSIILRGWYEEEMLKDGMKVLERHHAPCVIIRRGGVAHRITKVNQALTLFIAWKINSEWQLIDGAETPAGYIDWPDGIYEFDGGFRKRKNHRWFMLARTIDAAERSTKLSIYQNIHLCRPVSGDCVKNFTKV